MIIVGPGVKGQHQVDAFTYITDIMPTMLEMAKLKHPQKYGGREVAPMRGRSIIGTLSGDVKEIYCPDEPVSGEMAGGKWLRRATIKPLWYLLRLGQESGSCLIYREIPAKTDDLSEKYPEKLEDLKTTWKQYADDVGVC